VEEFLGRSLHDVGRLLHAGATLRSVMMPIGRSSSTTTTELMSFSAI